MIVLKSPCKNQGREPYRCATVAGLARTIIVMIAQMMNEFNRQSAGKMKGV